MMETFGKDQINSLKTMNKNSVEARNMTPTESPSAYIKDKSKRRSMKPPINDTPSSGIEF